MLQADQISKSFGPVKVLDGISIALEPGRVHAVIGENGAGKSTLMRILSGYLEPSGGGLLWEGAPIRFASAFEAERHGVVLIHQEILLADDLSVAQNLFLGREIRRGLMVDDAAMDRRTRDVLAELGTAIPADSEVRRLSLADRQFVQIARALLVPNKVVIFDEPTAVLTPVETEKLFVVIRRLREVGVAVLYVSHRLPEVKAISDTVTVLRDGRHVTTAPTSDLDPIDMARLMVGRDMAKLYPARSAGGGAVVLAAEGISVPGYVEDASFKLRRGEILGFGGLVGAGRTELFEGIVGLRPSRGGLELHGKPVHFTDVRASMKAGITYLSEDRKGKGLLLDEELRENLTLAALDRFARGGVMDVPAEEEALDGAISRFDIRVGRRNLLARQLSGGNQQKLFLAKMMLLEPRIVIIDEPTRGVDIGTKQQIYSFLANLAAQGVAVVVISSEMQELIGLCHRILVMRGGRIAGEVSGDEMTEDEIVFLATGVHEIGVETAVEAARPA
ncbi:MULTISPECIES: sugar ABC transporter ATP-binding protein [Rhodomicrobium]|uniref:sugar ABC transporter ATP-binding protein n=1 Tax=Rhodomicrobium TaxID=1068 RepID=UPI001FDAC597|nr:MULTISPECIES: sugar ABC transporter ATP-binding protein [Rhodomicrobium]